MEFCSTLVGPGPVFKDEHHLRRNVLFPLWGIAHYTGIWPDPGLSHLPGLILMASQKDIHTTLLGRKCVRVPSREVETDAFLPSDGLLAWRKKLGGSTFLLNPKGPRRTLVDSGGENVSYHIADKGVIYFRFVNLSVYAAFALYGPACPSWL